MTTATAGPNSSTKGVVLMWSTELSQLNTMTTSSSAIAEEEFAIVELLVREAQNVRFVKP